MYLSGDGGGEGGEGRGVQDVFPCFSLFNISDAYLMLGGNNWITFFFTLVEILRPKRND